MEHLVVTQIARHGYLAVFVLMTLESACVPVPSEAIMLFGGALAGGSVISGSGVHLNVVVVALAGAFGNLVGSWIAYAVGRTGGRRLLDRPGRHLLVRPDHLRRADAFFARHGQLAVLVGRVLPVVRTFISLPAGIARMPLARFSWLTLAGSLPWTFGLALTGDAVASHWRAISHAFTPVSVIAAVLAVTGLAVWLVSGRRSRPASAPAQAR